MPRLNLTFPFAGRVDNAAHHDQPALTTRAARNVRARDPVTGRLRGASRSGMSKFNPTVVGASKVKALLSTAFDTRQIRYAFTSGAETKLWDASTPAKEDSLNGKTDSQGNVYALNGPAGIAKFNATGTLIFSIKLPVADQAHVVRALWVDEFARIFAAVSAGGDVETARMWCIVQEPQEEKNQADETEFYILWTFEPRAYTEDLKVVKGLLYAAHNYTKERRSRVATYDNLSIEPKLMNRIETVAFPLHAIDVGDDGSVYATSPLTENTEATMRLRAGHTKHPKAHVPVVGWTPLDLPNAKRRIHSWFDADFLDDTDLEVESAGLDRAASAARSVIPPFSVEAQISRRGLTAEDIAAIQDGRQVLRWRDKSGNGRHWFAGTVADPNERGPQFVQVGPGGVPAIRFINALVGAETFRQSLVSRPNSSVATALADQQLTPVPAYTDSMWAMFILLRPTLEGEPVGPVPRVVFFSQNQATPTSTDHVLFVNRDSSTAAFPGPYALGFVSYSAGTDLTGDGGGGAAGPPPQARGYDFASNDRDTGCVLVTIMWDGGVEPDDTTKTRCVVRVNGRPIDRFEGVSFATFKEQWLAHIPGSTIIPAGRYNGDICEMLVLDRQNRFSLTEPKIATVDALETGSPGAAQTDTEVARIEAYMLGKRGLLHLLDPDVPTSYQHFYDGIGGTGSSVPAPTTGGISLPHQTLIKEEAVTTKHDSAGVLKWAFSSRDLALGGVALADRGGYGYGIRVRTLALDTDKKTHVWMTGPKHSGLFGPAVSAQVAVRKIIDNGAGFSFASADGAWIHKFTGNASPEWPYPKLDADQFGHLFLPYYVKFSGTGADSQWSLLVFKKDPDGGGLAQVFADFLLTGSVQAYAVALPPDVKTPNYLTDLSEMVSEKVNVFHEPADPGFGVTESVSQVRIVNVEAMTTGLPRDVVTLAVVDTDIKRITDASISVPTGGAAAIDTNAQYVTMIRAADDIVILDGTRYKSYAIRTGLIGNFESTTTGEIPPLAQLGMYWRHRLVLGRFADNAGGYAASALGNIRNWNFLPAVANSAQAFRGATTRAGEAEDALTAMIPVWDDLAYFLCESRILRLTGDPEDGGVIHKVTDSMGVSFGDSWCKDSVGRVFIFGNAPPGLYALPPDGDPVPLSRHSLEETEFARIDFSAHRMLLAWNPIDKGIHVFQVAWGTSTVVDHWFWEERTHRLVRHPPVWTDRFGLAGLQPTAVTYLGGDDTRCLLIGCADGFVRKWDPAALTDDGTAIDSHVMFGPVNPEGGPDAEWRLTETQVALASEQGGCRLELFGSENADDPGPVLAATDLNAGLNEGWRGRVKAEHIFLRLRNAHARRWALESISCDLMPASRQVPARER